VPCGTNVMLLSDRLKIVEKKQTYKQKIADYKMCGSNIPERDAKQ